MKKKINETETKTDYSTATQYMSQSNKNLFKLNVILTSVLKTLAQHFYEQILIEDFDSLYFIGNFLQFQKN